MISLKREKAGFPDIIDDFDFNARSDGVGLAILSRFVDPIVSFLTFFQQKAKEDHLQNFTESTEVHIINPPASIIQQYTETASCIYLTWTTHTRLDFSS